MADSQNNGASVIGARARVRWENDPGQIKWAYFSFGKEVADEDGDVVRDSFGVEDINIFYYCQPEDMDRPFEEFAVLSYEPVFSEDLGEEDTDRPGF